MDKDVYTYIVYFLFIIYIIYHIVKYKKKINKLSTKYQKKLNKLIDTKLNTKDNKIFIIPYLELGDNIILNGGIRYLVQKYKTLILTCKESYYVQISYMYRDLDNIIYYIIPDKFSVQYINYYIPVNDTIKMKFKKYNINYVSFINDGYSDMIHFVNTYVNNDTVYKVYVNLKLNVDIGYSYFKLIRDEKRENNLYNKLVNIIGDKYVVVIDDEKRNFLINNIYLKNIKLPIYKLSNNSKNNDPRLDSIHSEYIFDFIKILENAYEIYSIDTSVLWLIDYLNINTDVYVYSTRDKSVYRNKKLKKLKTYSDDVLTSNINIYNYLIKIPYESVISYF
jgi:preprotein translocase subunit YajC